MKLIIDFARDLRSLVQAGKHLLCIVCMLSLAHLAPAQISDSFSDLDSLLQTQMTGNLAHYLVSEVRAEMPRIAGIAFNTEQRGFVFVLNKQGRGFRLLARSEFFEFPDGGGRTAVEIVEMQGPDRFSLQINARSACGVYLHTYRFALTQNEWRVTGLDTTEPVCDQSGKIEIGATESRNFLTGQHRSRSYRQNKVTHELAHFHTYPVFKLNDFVPLDQRYESEKR